METKGVSNLIDLHTRNEKYLKAEKAKEKFANLKPKSFEEYMTYVFMEEVPEEAGDKETIDENCWNWIQTLDAYQLMEFVSKYEHKTF